MGRRLPLCLCCLLLACDARNGTCEVPEFCSTRSCCGITTTTCVQCVDGQWVEPANDDCYFACLHTCEPKAGFEGPCSAPAKKEWETVCNDAALDELMTCMGPTPDATRCAAVKAVAPACAACALSTWWSPTTGPDEAACVARFDAACGRATQCAMDCTAAVCRGCDSGPSPRWSSCAATAQKPSGPCAAHAAARDACAGKAAACFVRAPGDLRRFLGAVCGGLGLDGGTDAAPD